MKRFVSLSLALVLMVFMTGGVIAAEVNFQEELQKLALENAKGYLGPFATVFGTSMNSGLYHSAKPHSILGFDVSIKITGVAVSDDDKTFDFVVPATITIPQSVHQLPGVGDLTVNGNDFYPNRTSSTLFGPDSVRHVLANGVAIEDAMRAQGASDAQIAFAKSRPEWQQMLDQAMLMTPPGTDLPGAGIVLPQVSLGLPLKTEVLLRYFPETDIEKVGKLNFWGVGVKHSISQWIPVPMFGINISGQFAMQSLTIGDVIESNHTAFNVQASRTFSAIIISLTPYAGIGFESSNIKVDYTVTGSGNPALEGSTISLDLDGDNTSRITGGVRLGMFGILTLNADYSVGKYKAYSVGLGLTLR
ncbi:MAG: hypothetical protein FJY67_03910 [Calditrichaeota bacterium]|nr:hypothetical protein [Calditrichota bacterium]